MNKKLNDLFTRFDTTHADNGQTNRNKYHGLQ